MIYSTLRIKDHMPLHQKKKKKLFVKIEKGLATYSLPHSMSKVKATMFRFYASHLDT